MISDAFFLVVVRCFKNNLFFLPTFEDEGDTSSSI